MDRAYSLLTVKAVSEDRRIITGVATTPEPDRVGDIVEPLGVKFKNPVPLLHQHRSDQPVGTVRFNKPTKDGVTFEASLPKIEEPGPLKDRVDTAWGEIRTGLVRAVSIGFRAIEHAFMDDGGIRFIESEVLELSLVTIPANAQATIQTVKSIDHSLLAASGREAVDVLNPAQKSLLSAKQAASGHQQAASERPLPGVSGPTKPVKLRPKEGTKMRQTTADQISAFEATRQAKAARMEEIMGKAAETGETLDAEQSEEYDGLEAEIKSIDQHLNRLRTLEKSQASAAKPVDVRNNLDDGSQARAGVQVKAPQKLEPGIRLARVAKCIGIGKKNGISPVDVAMNLYGSDGAVVNIVKTAVGAGTTLSNSWAEDLVGDATAVFADFVEFLRPETIIGKFGMNGVPSLRRVPFRVPLVSQTGGGEGYWVGEGKPKPLTSFDFSRTTLEPLKVANIAVVSDEVLRDSSPSAEMIIRDSLAAALKQRLDIDFIDPDKAVSAGVSPASITNGITAISSTGDDADAVREDIKAMFAVFIAANNAPTTGVWIMSATTALAAGLMMNPLGQQEFPGLTMRGGSLFGLPVIVSEHVGSDSNGRFVFLVNAGDIYLADDGGIRVDMSREASLQMNDAPTTQDATTGTGTSLVSLWQTNTVGFLAERTISWARRRADAVVVLDTVNWGTAAS